MAEKLVFMVTKGPAEAELATVPFVMAAAGRFPYHIALTRTTIRERAMNRAAGIPLPETSAITKP